MATVVTGAAGFLGRAVVRRLVETGQDVVATDGLPVVGPGRLTVIIADLTGADRRVAAALAGAERVIHLAGRPGVRDAGVMVDRWRKRDNVDATAAVLRLAPLSTPVVVA